MQIDPKTLEEISKRPSGKWTGIVFRHTFAEYPPDRENTVGARWNPPGVAAIYTSLKRETALAEAEYQIAMQPNRPRAKRTIYQIKLSLSAVFALTHPEALAAFGLSSNDLSELDMYRCQGVGGAVEHCHHDGLLVPSARHDGENLVIFPRQANATYQFEMISTEVIQVREF